MDLDTTSTRHYAVERGAAILLSGVSYNATSTRERERGRDV